MMACVTPRNVAFAHGAFMLVSGTWPIASIRTFERITGPKTDKWLVKTVGALIAVVAARTLDDARRDRVDGGTALLAAGLAAALGYVSTTACAAASRASTCWTR